jgi:hypothetical protein
MKFKLNTIENFKRKGIILSIEVFQKAIVEFNLKKNRMGKLFELNDEKKVFIVD